MLLEASLQQARAHEGSPHTCFVPLLEVAAGDSPGTTSINIKKYT
jgi:hypothetical protein